MECDDSIKKEVDSKIIREGRAEILTSKTQGVFYNPVQEFNRDLSIAVLSVFSKESRPKRKKKRNAEGEICESNENSGISIFEPLSASGLRSIRFALEIEPKPKEIVANDISKSAVESIQSNIEHNKVGDIVSTSHNDASAAMHTFVSNGKRFDAVDLDPYGCPSRFLDSTVQVVEDGGIILVTCTDMAVLAGNTPETCYTKYGSIPLKTYACHEMALRIAIQCLQSHANRYGRYIVPLLSISADFYIRIFVKIFTSPQLCKETTSNLSYVFRCVGCKSFRFQPLGVKNDRADKPPLFVLPRFQAVDRCQDCNHEYQMGGPIWTGQLHDREFLSRLIIHMSDNEEKFKTSKRIIGMLTIAHSELVDIPLYYTVDSICSIVHCVVIPLLTFRCALLNAGFSVSESHAAPNSVKTDAPSGFIWKIIRAWVKEHPISKKRLECNIVKNLMEPKNDDVLPEVNFSETPLAKIPSRGLLRYQVNPTKFWGPGVRSTNNANENSKSKNNQNKNKIKNNQENSSHQKPP